MKGKAAVRLRHDARVELLNGAMAALGTFATDALIARMRSRRFRNSDKRDVQVGSQLLLAPHS